jgi:mutator protein MutT
MINLTYDGNLLRLIDANLRRFKKQVLPLKNGAIKAAVAITIVDIHENPNVYDIPFKKSWAGHGAIVLTRRAANLRNHSGQWALPGGRVDAGETPIETVLRELEEEIGLTLTANQVIGMLDDYATRSGFNITPVVLWGGSGITLHPNPAEVASIHRIPLAEFMRSDAPILEKIPESENPVLLMPVGSSWIAAPTAAMLFQFREVALLGNAKRVAHYEQPYFAWR